MTESGYICFYSSSLKKDEASKIESERARERERDRETERERMAQRKNEKNQGLRIQGITNPLYYDK